MKKRLNRAQYRRLGMSCKSLILLVGMTVLALFYVWQHVQSVQLGYEIRSYESSLAKLQKQNRNLQMEFSYEKMPSRVLARVEDRGLGLKLPEQWHLVKVKMDPVLYPDEFMVIDWDAKSLNMNPIIRVSKESHPDIS